MKTRVFFGVLLVLVMSGVGRGTAGADTGWMQPGVRVWYFGGVGNTVDQTSSNAEEAYLITAVSGAGVQVVHHSALTHWTSPLPVETSTSPAEMGPCWINPARLLTLQAGDHWMGQEIFLVLPSPYTYAAFLSSVLPAKVNFLPIKALFELAPVRQIVKIRFRIDDFSFGDAYFDGDSGLLLYQDALWENLNNAKFFVLAEINYNFANHVAFAEDDGPHTGYNSFVAESSMNFSPVRSGSVVIQSLVETRYGSTVEMRVSTALSGPYGAEIRDENYCFFGDVPLVTRMDATRAGDLPPEQWEPFGQYLWWWLPPPATGIQRTVARATSVEAALQNITVYNVLMTKTADQPLTYVAAQTPATFYFSALWFDTNYLTKFAASAAPYGLDVRPGDYIFENKTTVEGIDYYRNVLAPAAGVTAPGPPTNVTVSSSGSGVSLSWTAPTTGGAPTSYIIEAGSATGLANLANFATGNTATSYSASGVGAGTYYLRVRAYNSAGTSAPSNETVLTVGGVLAAPGPPSGLTASSSGASVLLTWQGPTTGGTPTSYVIEAGSASGRTDLASFATGNAATICAVSGVGAGIYYVRVRASNSAGTSASSNEAVLTVGGGVPGPPSGLIASSSGASVLLTWQAPTNGGIPTSYIIAAGSATGLADLANFGTGSSATSFTATVVGAGTYYVRVRAANVLGISTPSNEAVLIIVGACNSPAGIPSGLVATVTGANVMLTWHQPAGCVASAYVIQAGTAPGLGDLANFSTGGTATSFSGSNLPDGTYYVRVLATNASGTSGPSNEVQFTIVSAPE